MNIFFLNDNRVSKEFINEGFYRLVDTQYSVKSNRYYYKEYPKDELKKIIKSLTQYYDDINTYGSYFPIGTYQMTPNNKLSM